MCMTSRKGGTRWSYRVTDRVEETGAVAAMTGEDGAAEAGVVAAMTGGDKVAVVDARMNRGRNFRRSILEPTKKAIGIV